MALHADEGSLASKMGADESDWVFTDGFKNEMKGKKTKEEQGMEKTRWSAFFWTGAILAGLLAIPALGSAGEAIQEWELINPAGTIAITPVKPAPRLPPGGQNGCAPLERQAQRKQFSGPHRRAPGREGAQRQGDQALRGGQIHDQDQRVERGIGPHCQSHQGSQGRPGHRLPGGLRVLHLMAGS